MKQIRFLILISLTILAAGCGELSQKHWKEAIPQNATGLIVPEEESSLQDILKNDYIPFLDDISASAIPIVSQVEQGPQENLPVKAIAMYPTTSTSWDPVWITEAPNNFDRVLREHFFKRFSQNSYEFKDTRIQKLHLDENILFAVQLHNWLFVSESSLAVEEFVRAYKGAKSRMTLSSDELNPGRFILNTPSFDKWIGQLTNVQYLPSVRNSFSGTQPASFSITNNGTLSRQELLIEGNIPLDTANMSDMVAAISSSNEPIKLDRYISSNVASFLIFRLPATTVPPKSVPSATRLDSFLLDNPDFYKRLANATGSELALSIYEESGFLSEGEYMFTRYLDDHQEFNQLMNELAAKDLVSIEDDLYYIQSSVLSKLLGSSLSNFDDFYLATDYKAVVMSKRKGLAESVKSDRSRRRVIYYDDQYLQLKENYDRSLSFFGMVKSEPFMNFIDPYLSPENYASTLFSNYDILTLAGKKDPEADAVSLELRTHQAEESQRPYEENWVFPLNSDITGPPVLANIGGSSRDEIIFSTTAGDVYALATDGTTVLQTTTGTDEPVGAPMVYDWYGTNQQTLMQGAGNKVYAWNQTGEELPKFPMELPETLSAPINVADVTRDGIPELLAATSDRSIHILDGRGEDIEGWPKRLNAPIKHPPVFENYNGSWSVFGFAANTLHAYEINGDIRKGFPLFINTSWVGKPIFEDNHIIGGAANGHLIAIGQEPMFADSLSSSVQTAPGEAADTLATDQLSGGNDDMFESQSIYVSNSSLRATPSIHELSVSTDGGEVRNERMILTASGNGSIFLFSKNGEILFTKSMGQPSAVSFAPFIANVENDRYPEVFSLADYGRLYGWEIYSGKRLYSLPTTGMQNPIIVDMENDGQLELIAQTREGLRCWTLYPSEIGPGEGQ